jgi:hypothetical protein
MKVPEFKWLHVASEGEFAGHVDGEFTLDRDVFNQFVQNFRSDPRYRSDRDGVGNQPVIPFDFEHASELSATSGTIPTSGSPAPAWALEVEVREGDDGAELWTYAKLGELIRGYIENDEYRHVSIAFALDAVDPITGKPIGARLSSIAFTNSPYLRNLRPLQIAASMKGNAMRRILFGRSVSLDDGGEERPPRDLTDLPLGDLDAPNAVEKVAAALVELDPELGELTDAELDQFALECIQFTKSKRGGAHAELSNRERNPLRLTQAEFDAAHAAPNPVGAAVAILTLRNPAFGNNERRHFLPETRALADRLRAWANSEPDNEGEGEPQRQLSERQPGSGRVSQRLRALFENATGPNPVARMALAIRQSDEHPGFDRLELSQQLRIAAGLVRACGVELRPLMQPTRPSRSYT